MIPLSKETTKLTPPRVEGLCTAQTRQTAKSTTVLVTCKKSTITKLYNILKQCFFLAILPPLSDFNGDRDSSIRNSK